MTIGCALRWGVASIRVYFNGCGSPFMEKHFKCMEYTSGWRSLEAAIVKKAGLWVYKNIFVNLMCKLVLPCILLCKRVVIKPLWAVFNYNPACFKLKWINGPEMAI